MTYIEGFTAESNRQNQRAQLQLQKRQLDAQLLEQGYNPDGSVVPNSDTDFNRKNNEVLIQSINALHGKLAAEDSDRGISEYVQTGDATALQNTLNKNNLLKSVWSKQGVQAIAPLDFTNDAGLLNRGGFPTSSFDTPAKQAVLKKNLYKVYDGTDWRLGSLSDAVQSTGAAGRLPVPIMDQIHSNHEEAVNMMRGPKVNPYTAEGNKYEFEINKAAELTGVPKNLIASMINQEANKTRGQADPNSLGPVTRDGWQAQGLMQLSPAIQKQYGVTDPYDPEQNIVAGASYMKDLLQKYNGNVRLALAGYNAGPGAVNKYQDVPPFAETQGYVKKIMANYAQAESFYNAGDATGSPQQLAERVNNVRSFQKNQDQTTVSDYFQPDANNAVPNANPSADELVTQHMKNQQAIQRADGTIDTINKFYHDQSLASGKAKVGDGEHLTAAEKNLAEADTQTKQMLNDFGGEDAFFKTDFTDPQNFNKAYNYIVKIQKLQGTNYTTDDKKKIADIRNLINLGDPASKLSSEQTGFFDSAFTDAKKYFSDDPTGLKSKSAYNAFRNVMRHALYGSALTQGEIDAFNSAFGSDKQQQGAALAQLRVALSQVKNNLESVTRFGNPYVNKVLLGADQNHIDNIMAGIDARLKAFGGSGPATASSAPASDGGDSRRPLDDIFNQ